MDFINTLDSALTSAIYSLPHNQFFDIFFHFFSGSGIFGFIWVLGFAFIVLKEHKRSATFTRSFFTSLIAVTIIANLVVKNIFQRVRPLNSLEPLEGLNASFPSFFHIPLTYPTDFSFPSGHTSFAFCAAYVLAKYDKKNALLYYIIALLTGYSRIYLGFHYVNDVFFGAMFGMFIGWLTLNYFDKKLVTRKI